MFGGVPATACQLAGSRKVPLAVHEDRRWLRCRNGSRPPSFPGVEHSIPEERTMKPFLISDAGLAMDPAEEIHAWRAEQLRHLGFPRRLAEKFAGLVDWHEVAALVARGCPPALALEIVR